MLNVREFERFCHEIENVFWTPSRCRVAKNYCNRFGLLTTCEAITEKSNEPEQPQSGLLNDKFIPFKPENVNQNVKVFFVSLVC